MSLLIVGKKANGGVRPIAISESFYKLTTMYAISLVKDALPGVFEPIQFGVGAPGGPERAAHILQAGLESDPESILLKCDIRNAFNERKRAGILAELYKVDVLKPLWSLSYFAYKQSSPLLILRNGVYVDAISCQRREFAPALSAILFRVLCAPQSKEENP